jgi:hypothetical protein
MNMTTLSLDVNAFDSAQRQAGEITRESLFALPGIRLPFVDLVYISPVYKTPVN